MALTKIAAGVALLALGATVIAHLSYRKAAARSDAAWSAVASRAEAPTARFEEAMLDGLPEIAKRYFRHAIALGTPLSTAAELEMRGTFLLGDKVKHQAYAMEAEQILRPPFEFVWKPTLRSGAMIITGSDGLADGRAWTRFWLNGLVPVANVGTSPDVLRSATFRAATEGVWIPATLLPQTGARWEQLSDSKARVTITRTTPHIVLDLTIAENGALREIVGQRWSNANPEQTFRQQPFGGTVEGERTFGGFTVPAQLHVGNHYGTDDYLPFFQADVRRITYL
jgi:hypothetical protein